METNNWQAFNLATDALRDIDRFASSSAKNRKILVSAKEKLEGAVKKDPSFIRARYYSAIVDDMLGQPAKAATELESLLATKPMFREEAEYNLGVSYYHLYSREQMERAIAKFESVAEQTTDTALKYMARAGLIRGFAMMVLHSLGGGDEQDAAQFAEKTATASDELLAAIGSDELIDRRTRNEIKWRVLNGRGVGLMFYSDSEADTSKRKAELERALRDFEVADSLSPNNWEIVCNLGSVHMRLAYVEKLSGPVSAAQSDFQKAHRYLQDVISRIRPNYGFALYEMGRVCRIEGDFAGAGTWFEKALQIPDDERNISAKRLEAELEKVRLGSDKFP